VATASPIEEAVRADVSQATSSSAVTDERRLIADANMHLPGRQIDPDMVRRDLLRLSRWERERLSHSASEIKRAA